MDYREKYAPYMIALCAILWPCVMLKMTYVDNVNPNIIFGLLVEFVLISLSFFLFKQNKKKLSNK